MMESRLEELFRLCDRTGSGLVGKPELRSLCAQFGISSSDADAIFLDLDHDGDGSISFSEFSHGFRDFATPGSRRGSLQIPDVSVEKLDEMGRKHASAKGAWTTFSATLGLVPEYQQDDNDLDDEQDHNPVPTSRSPKNLDRIPEESLGKTLSILMSDVTRLTDDYRSLETSFRRSAQAHAAQLEALGEEMDQQLAKTEARAKAEAREEAAKQMDAERRKITSEMEFQLSDLSEQLVSFKKVWLEEEAKREKIKDAGSGSNSSSGSGSGDELEFENRNLRAALLETQTKAALLQSQLVLKRNDYRDLYEELHS